MSGDRPDTGRVDSGPPDTGRVALVTGAGRGIGAETVRALCRRGYRVVAVDSGAGDTATDLPGVDYPLASREQLAALRAAHPDQIHTVLADVRDRAALDAAAATAVERFGRLDAAVAAAAVMVGGQPLWETPATHVQTLWDVDVLGVWNTAAACVPHMLAGPDPGGCRFTAVASAAGTRGLFHLAGYSMAKHAVIGLVRGLAADLVGTGVTAVAVSPGSTRTAMLAATAALYDLDGVESFASGQLTGRLIDPGEIAETIAFCCSVAGGVLTGSVVSAEGGFRG
ncbi:mycofactocin-coupled SDR family oxidoreductase [Parafrankia sp. EUN1f]|uniref:mycofactocin-coupled SDR family oxidoreductase n=1 Tax=Parafrankia sp. EUN1f TaxID=102897 RepID=UPI0001C43ABB|nr:mycofactocin-coupled SDR family oxidoreductase [Parafrankia sp. EUN1f]EFC83041.1 short-chain dehydrogenase/reductase SDR [Parafrankia sp. EUN1f]